MINWKDPLIRANLLGAWVTLMALLGLPLFMLGLPGFPFLGLKPDPLSGAGAYEPFAMELTLMMQTKGNEFIARRLTPEFWHQVGGVARSRTYARALTAAPQLPPTQWDWILAERLNGAKGRLAEELGIPDNVSSLALSLKSNTPGRPNTWLLEPTQ